MNENDKTNVELIFAARLHAVEAFILAKYPDADKEMSRLFNEFVLKAVNAPKQTKIIT